MKKLRLSAEYQCYPTWIDDDGLDNVDPNSLGIPQPLAAQIDAWDERFQKTYHPNDPANSGFDQEGDQERFLKDGMKIFKQLKRETARIYQVEYRAIDGGRYK